MKSLAEELRQNKPFPSLEDMVFLNILRTGDQLLAGETEVLKTAELSFPQYNILRILRGAGKPGMPCGEIAERMVSRDPDMTRLLDRLEDRALVTRSRQKPDRRMVIARITSEGRKILKQLDGPVNCVHRRQLGRMTRKQLHALAELLDLARNSKGEIA